MSKMRFLNSEMSIIDIHLHAFPDKLAPRVLKSLSDSGGGLVPCFDGTMNGLSSLLQQAGIKQGVVLTIAAKPSQEESVNRFAIENNSPDLKFFGSIHPRSKRIREQLQELKDAGIPGIKFHPEYQHFNVDDPAMLPIYTQIAEMGFVTLFHAGLDVSYDLPGHCRPASLARALPYFGGAPVIAAHLGGYMLWEEVERELVGKDIYLDTSYSHSRVLIPQLTRIIRNHGADKIVFGSDAPWSQPLLEAGLIKRLEISAAEKEAILVENARRLLGFREIKG
ncbi:MAG: amidohydrolase family protein [Saccharofermentanales bacterium]